MNSRSEISPVSPLQPPSRNLTILQPVRINHGHKILINLETNCVQARITCGKVELLLLVVKCNCLWHFVEFDNIATNAHDTVYYHFYPELFANKLKSRHILEILSTGGCTASQ